MERLAPLLVSFMSRDFGQKLRRVRRNGLLYLVCGLLALTAYGAGVAGAVLALANAYGAVAALFALSIASLALAVAALAAVLMCNRHDRTLAAASPVGGTLLGVAAASLLPLLLRSRLVTGAAILATIAVFAFRSGADGGDDSSSPP
ncbi:hypothetical protein [Azospirillum sp.]|uniref:hypothetical protein n=1 Tax=Azospirillum sp. TaxID=34012 RepID=UPI0026060E9B|nr:hypothetical protein [Azospirillum sp.]